ncbi:MAG: type II secretion system protein GspL [Gammaproteobacteria bacterium]|nr:type II secretion system protein GspL [Gammaproteobacteria bacterium]
MSEKLILRLSSQTTSSVPWLVWETVNNDIIASGELSQQSELSSLSEYAKGRQVITLVDSADVRLYRHYMPTKPSRQILKALPFMLEDELSEDIEQLHFALHDTGFDADSNKHWVNIAIVRKALLQHWTNLLAEHDIQSKIMLPDVLCLPVEQDNSVSAIEFAGGWLVNDNHWQGTHVLSDWTELFWQKKLAELDEENALIINAYSPLSQQTMSLFDSIESVSINVQDAELPLLLLAKQAQTLKWNLLQGDFAPKKAVSKNWQIWRPVAVLFVITVIVHLIQLGSRWSKAESELQVAKASLSESYKKAFPKERVRLNIIRTQLRRKVAQVTGEQTSEAGFLTLMSAMTPVFSKLSNIKYESFRFDGTRQELRINASAPNFQQFERLIAELGDLGLDVKQGAINNEGNEVSGTLSVKEGN